MEHPSNDFDKLFGGDDDFDDGIDSDADTEKEEEEIAPGNKGKRYRMSYQAPKNSIDGEVLEEVEEKKRVTNSRVSIRVEAIEYLPRPALSVKVLGTDPVSNE